VTGVCDAFCEILQQNVRELPPGSILAWKKLLLYTGSSFRLGKTDQSIAFRLRSTKCNGKINAGRELFKNFTTIQDMKPSSSRFREKLR